MTTVGASLLLECIIHWTWNRFKSATPTKLMLPTLGMAKQTMKKIALNASVHIVTHDLLVKAFAVMV